MNRRYRELKKEILDYTQRLEEATTISDSLIYKGKLESLEREKKEIESKY